MSTKRPKRTEAEERELRRKFILEEIVQERVRQGEKFNYPMHPDPKWSLILTEETGEVARAILEGADLKELETEVRQIAGVCLAWLEQIARHRNLPL